MSSPRFTRYVLRTTDVEAAASFYEAVLGRAGDGIVPLPEPAIARGARPHWLGHIGVRDIGGAEAVAARFVARGATRLGGPAGTADPVVLRDPGGAIVAVTDVVGESSAGAAWHQLNTRAPESAATTYATLLGWDFRERLDLGGLGRHQSFAFGAGESRAGVFSDVAGRPEVHTHWLYFFSVPSLELAAERVRAHGGVVLGPFALPNGARVAACDDPQGAAFGLVDLEDAGRLASGSA